MSMTFRLNGELIALQGAEDTTLADMLRDRLGLTSVKIGCGVGRCGACLALVNGKPVNACLTMAFRLDGAEVITAEGLDALPEAEIVRRALIAENAFQCGYCAPGFTMALTALLIDRPDATDVEIKAGLDGNLCRCTGYHSILRGALAARDQLRLARAERDPK